MNFLKSYSKTAHLFAGFVAASVAVSMSVSCSKSNGSGKVSIQDDPVGTYGKFLTEIKGRDILSTDELAGQIGRWQTLRDSVFYYAIRDTAGNPHSIRIRSTATASLSYQIHYRIHIHGSCR